LNKRVFHKTAVLMGGFSSEREVSLRSGAAVAKGLRECGYAVAEIDIRRPEFDLPPGTEAVFIALHGEFGEDGQIQALLEQRGVPYTGADPAASRLAFDKDQSKRLLIRAGVATPAYEVLRAGGRRTLPLPVVVKPVRQGSSYGVHRVLRENEWAAALAEALTYNGEVIVEPFIDGKELTVGLVGEELLPVIEIRAPDNNYDYHAKYTKGVTEYLVPAPLTKAETELAQRLALATYRTLGGRGMGRVDLRLAPDGGMFVLELNTIPGFTETSLLPKAAAAAGYSFARLCDRILRLASLVV
jgi:D-alanine-D-alanine ligase